MSREDRGKLVEVWDSHESDREPYRLVLGSSWTVQSKTSNSGKRFAFQVRESYIAAFDYDQLYVCTVCVCIEYSLRPFSPIACP